MSRIHRLTIAVFLLMLYTPMVIMLLTPDGATSSFENRPLAQFPALANRPLKDILTDIEAYVSDQFGLRETLASLHGALYYYGFNTSSSESVVIGKANWLFYASTASENSIEDYRGLIRLPDDYLRDAAGYLQARKDWLEAQGIRYLFVIAPDKHTIYPEYVPDTYTVLNTERRIDQFIAHVQANTDVDLLDLRAPLREAKDTGAKVFLQYDTHWSVQGAYTGYQAIVAHLGIAAIDGWMPVPALHTGDLGLLMGLRLTEQTLHYEYPEACAQPAETPLPDDLPYWVELHAFRCASGMGNALIFHDSFVDPMRIFLAEHFAHSLFAKARYEPALAAPLVAFVQPDVVIEEMVERRVQSYFDYSP
jgi:alginate O-acetyltransferase complex protein AlgJ